MLPGLSHPLSETTRLLQESVQSFANKVIAPIAAEIDTTNQFPRYLWPQLGQLGLLGITVNEEFGGSGMSYLDHVIVMEILSCSSAAVGLSYAAHSNLCVNQIHRLGTLKQKQKYLPKLITGEHVGALAISETGAGSDTMNMKLNAEQKGEYYFLN